MRFLLLTIYFIIPLHAICQEYDNDLGKGKINKNVCARFEVGWQRSWFTSIGASYVYSNVNSHSPTSLVVYGALEADLAGYSPRSPFYAYKAGFEFGGALMALGAELRNNTDFAATNHLIFTPRAGLTVFGHLGLYYGYNTFKSSNNVFGIGRSQISLNVNLNRKVLKESSAPRH
ncbi:MAG: hypothetical protein EOP56_01725 [Sphingobacteriales bacterium]|nr:MAG: hypothetical protein EOP56_01725 [Sphingobacteriales bacterium]